MALAFAERCNGVPIFPKSEYYLRSHYQDWQKKVPIKAKIESFSWKQSKKTLKEISQRSSAAVTQNQIAISQSHTMNPGGGMGEMIETGDSGGHGSHQSRFDIATTTNKKKKGSPIRNCRQKSKEAMVLRALQFVRVSRQRREKVLCVVEE
mmetsp:Transcript_21287/g.32154  ORF Transcript_21287/g.32154 Transcript_21287/m.32154 type:complete len:151 (+) Transcript_21287:1122-1574(+)